MEYPHSNQCTESDFFRLGPFGPHLDTKPNLREEQRDCLSSTRLTYSLGHTNYYLGLIIISVYVSLTLLILARILH